MEDPADNIRRRRRELQEVGFGAREAAVAIGPEAEEQEFTDRFKRQYTARQAKMDAARLAAAAAAAERSANDAVLADRKGLMQDMIPSGDLRIPQLDPQEYDSEDSSLRFPPAAPSPGESAPVAAITSQPRPALRRPEFRPPNVPQALVSGEKSAQTASVERNRASAAAARLVRPVAQLARDRQVERERAAAPGGLNVSPERVAEDLAAAQQAAATPAPVKSGEQELRERQDRARDSKEIEQYQIDKMRYDADMQVWRTQLDAAFEAGDDVRAAELSKQEPQPPEPPQSVTGGLDPNEVKANWDHDNDPSTPRVAESAAQTLQRLAKEDPAAYRKLQATAQAAVGNDPEALGEWVSSQFGELEPDARFAQMQSSGQRLIDNDKRMNFAMPEGSRGGIGSPGRPGGARAPEGKQALDPATGKPMIIRDPANAGRVEPIPMPQGGLLPTPRGNVGRAPQNQAALGEGGLGIESLDTFPVSPEAMTPQWRQQMQGIGAMAFGLDRSQFAEGPEGDDLYIAATQKLLAAHQKKVAAGFEAVPEVTGGYSYRPGKGHRDRQKKRETDREVNKFLAARPAGSRDPDPDNPANMVESPEAQELRAAAASGDRDRYLAAKDALAQKDREERRSALNTRRRLEADQKNRDNPAVAPGMFRASLAQAGNDPAAIEAVYRDWGMPREARVIRELENDRLAVEQAGAAARAKAEAERPVPDFKIAEGAQRAAVDGVLDGTQAHDVAVQTMATTGNIYNPASNEPMTDAQRSSAEILLARQILQRGGANIMHPSVQVAVRNIWNSTRNDGVWRYPDQDGMWRKSEREMFRINLERQLGITDRAFADRMYDQYSATNG